LAEHDWIEQLQDESASLPPECIVDDATPTADELPERGVHSARYQAADEGNADRESERLHAFGDADILNESLPDGSMATGGVIGRTLDKNVLPVGEGEFRAIVIDDVERERLHQGDRGQRLDDPFPKCLAIELGEEAYELCSL